MKDKITLQRSKYRHRLIAFKKDYDGDIRIRNEDYNGNFKSVYLSVSQTERLIKFLQEQLNK
jgi:hypothetical protein